MCAGTRLADDMQERDARVLQRLTLWAALVALLMVVAGNVVRLSGDGPSCPDWPLCFGAVLPVDNAKATAEVVHRGLAALTAGLIAAVVVVGFRRRAVVSRSLLSYSLGALSLVAAQVISGAWASLRPWPAWQPLITAFHLIAGLATLGLIVAIHVEARYALPAQPPAQVSPPLRRLRRRLHLLIGVIFALLISGALVSGSGAALACGQTFPICNGGWLPNGGSLVFLQWLHRAAVFVAAALLPMVMAMVWRREVRAHLPLPIRVAALTLSAAFVVVGLLGWLMVALNRPAILATLHNAASGIMWVSAIVLVMLADRLPVDIPERPRKPVPAWRQTLDDLVALTKPRVVSLLLFTTLAAMFITSAGPPPWYLVVWTMIGGYLMAGGANAVNMAYDSDIDRVMGRTSARPVPSGRITPRRALIFGLSLAALSFLIFLLFVNGLAALLAVAGFVYYTVIYTRWLKRSTWQNIVIGGGAGAIPPMIGWAAASGRLSVAALLLFAIVFYWTPPHFWALALLKRKDYAAAGVPMLPVVAGETETARQILIYSVGMVALTLLPVPLRMMGGVYLAGALALGSWFLWLAWRVNEAHTAQAALKLYIYSLLYLFALFAMMMVDRAVS